MLFCCKICGEYKVNEKFSEKGHAAHNCKICFRLSADEEAEAMYSVLYFLKLPRKELPETIMIWTELLQLLCEKGFKNIFSS